MAETEVVPRAFNPPGQGPFHPPAVMFRPGHGFDLILVKGFDGSDRFRVGIGDQPESVYTQTLSIGIRKGMFRPEVFLVYALPRLQDDFVL